MRKFRKFVRPYLIFPLLFYSSYGLSAVTTDNVQYGASQAMTCTGFNSLANSATVCISCTAVSNTGSLAIDAYTTVLTSTSVSALGTNPVVSVYGYWSEDGSTYVQDAAGSPAVSGGYTIDSPTNFSGPVQINTASSGKQYVRVFPMSLLFGSPLPRKWGLVLCNVTGQSLAAAGNSVTYTTTTFTNQ